MGRPQGGAPDASKPQIHVLTVSWTLTGPCDGTGPCEWEQCDASGCGAPVPGESQGSGYVSRFSTPVAWDEPQCTGGTTDNTVTWAVTGEGDDITVTGSWVQQATQVLFTGTDGASCGLVLTEWSISSQ